MHGAFGKRVSYKDYSQQDVLIAISKNVEFETKKSSSQSRENDIIAISRIDLPDKGSTIPKLLNNFYNCVNSHQVSHFNSTSLVIVG